MATPQQMYQQTPPPQAYQQPPPPQNFQQPPPVNYHQQQLQQPPVAYQQQVPVHYQQQVPVQYQQQPAVHYQQQTPVQYQQQAAMTQAQVRGQTVQNQEWQNSLFDCGPAETCLLGACVPCVLLGKTAERMQDPTLAKYEFVNNDCMIMCGIQYLTGCGWIWVMMKRQEIRERYGIKGSGGSDCFEAYCCPCCALIQQDKEVERRAPAAPAAPVVQGYQPQKEGMQMPQN